MLKTPFSTNRENMKFVHSADAILAELRSLSLRLGDVMPCVMLQACMSNRKEYDCCPQQNSVSYLFLW